MVGGDTENVNVFHICNVLKLIQPIVRDAKTATVGSKVLNSISLFFFLRDEIHLFFFFKKNAASGDHLFFD